MTVPFIEQAVHYLAATVTSMNTMSTETRKYTLKARAEAQDATREKIVAAAADLHEEVGVARATVSEIARRRESAD